MPNPTNCETKKIWTFEVEASAIEIDCDCMFAKFCESLLLNKKVNPADTFRDTFHVVFNVFCGSFTCGNCSGGQTEVKATHNTSFPKTRENHKHKQTKKKGGPGEEPLLKLYFVVKKVTKYYVPHPNHSAIHKLIAPFSIGDAGPDISG